MVVEIFRRADPRDILGNHTTSRCKASAVGIWKWCAGKPTRLKSRTDLCYRAFIALRGTVKIFQAGWFINTPGQKSMLVARHVWVQIFQGCSFQQEIMLKWYYGDGGSKINLFCKITT